MKRFCALLLVTYPFIAGYVQALALSNDNLENEVPILTAAEVHKLAQNNEDQITELRNQLIKLQQAYAELVAKDLVEYPNTRNKRDDDKPQSATPPSSDDKQPLKDQSPVSNGSSALPRFAVKDQPDGPTCPQQSGVVYIRWGSKVCPEEAELIYKGTVGGAHWTHDGSGSNYLCMPDVPIYDERTSPNTYRALLYSSEYQTNEAPSRPRSKLDHAPTCAVCKAPSGRTTKLMIPGRNVCPDDDWRLEYAGYLMAERYTHKRTEFVCVDRGMDYEPGTQGSQNGACFYMVEARCQAGGGLHCGPYVNGYELTCAVCTI